MPFGTPVPPSPDTSVGAARGVRGARDRVRAGSAGRVRIERRQGRARRRLDAAVRPLPRRAEAPRSRRRPGERDGGERLHPGRLGGRSPRSTRASTPSVTSPPSALRRQASSPSARRASSPHALLAEIAGAEPAAPYDGTGSCYIEFGAGRVGRVDVDFFSGPKPTGTYHEASAGARRREEALRLQPPRPLVRPGLTPLS